MSADQLKIAKVVSIYKKGDRKSACKTNIFVEYFW